MLHDLLHRILGSHSLKVNDAAGKSCRRIAKQIPSVENSDAFRAFSPQTVHAFIDLPHRFDPDKTLYMRQGTVIRRHDIISVHRLRHTGAALCAHPRVHHRNIDRSLRPELQALV